MFTKNIAKTKVPYLSIFFLALFLSFYQCFFLALFHSIYLSIYLSIFFFFYLSAWFSLHIYERCWKVFGQTMKQVFKNQILGNGSYWEHLFASHCISSPIYITQPHSYFPCRLHLFIYENQKYIKSNFSSVFQFMTMHLKSKSYLPYSTLTVHKNLCQAENLILSNNDRFVNGTER